MRFRIAASAVAIVATAYDTPSSDDLATTDPETQLLVLKGEDEASVSNAQNNGSS